MGLERGENGRFRVRVRGLGLDREEDSCSRSPRGPWAQAYHEEGWTEQIANLLDKKSKRWKQNRREAANSIPPVRLMCKLTDFEVRFRAGGFRGREEDSCGRNRRSVSGGRPV